MNATWMKATDDSGRLSWSFDSPFSTKKNFLPPFCPMRAHIDQQDRRNAHSTIYSHISRCNWRYRFLWLRWSTTASVCYPFLISEICKIKKHLMFHLARHTFVTIITLMNGMPIESISKMLVHTKLRAIMIYAKVTQRKLAIDMAMLQPKMNENE